MKNRIKLLVAFLWLATVGMGALAFPLESQHPSSRPLWVAVLNTSPSRAITDSGPLRSCFRMSFRSSEKR